HVCSLHSTTTSVILPLSLRDALPISRAHRPLGAGPAFAERADRLDLLGHVVGLQALEAERGVLERVEEGGELLARHFGSCDTRWAHVAAGIRTSSSVVGSVSSSPRTITSPVSSSTKDVGQVPSVQPLPASSR